MPRISAARRLFPSTCIEPAIQGATPDAENFRRTPLVSVDLLQYIANIVLLNNLEGHQLTISQGRLPAAVLIQRGDSNGLNPLRQMLDIDLPSGTESHSALNHIC